MGLLLNIEFIEDKPNLVDAGNVTLNFLGFRQYLLRFEIYLRITNIMKWNVSTGKYSCISF